MLHQLPLRKKEMQLLFTAQNHEKYCFQNEQNFLVEKGRITVPITGAVGTFSEM